MFTYVLNMFKIIDLNELQNVSLPNLIFWDTWGLRKPVVDTTLVYYQLLS